MRRFARLLRETADRHGVAAQLWVPSFGLTREDVPDLEAAITAAREEGVDDLWTWGYEACRHMTHLATPDSPLVWEAVSAALTARPQTATTEAARADLADLDLRSTRDLVRLLNEEDTTVPAAVADAGDALAEAIDAIVERMRRGGRLIYAGAGTSGALAALDAAECGPTFGSPPGEVLAVVADQDEATRTTCCGDERTARVSPPARGLRRRRQRERRHAVRPRRARSRARGGCARGRRRQRPRQQAAALAEHEVAAVVGPEVIAGSTRLKAGTAQKLVLNTISTVTMIRLGRTYGGLMVGVAPANEKLRERARRNVVLASGAVGGAGGRGAAGRGRRRARRARLAAGRGRRRRRSFAARSLGRLGAEGEQA